MTKVKSCLKRSAIVFTVLYIAFCAAVYIKPQLFFYNPTDADSNIERARRNGYPAEEVEYASADGTKLLAWFTKPAAGRPVIVFMHGNSYNIEKFYHKMIPLMEAGYGTLMPEYRGFGNLPGVITQQNLTADAAAAVDYLHGLGYANRDIILYGMSLGSHMATNTAYSLGKTEPFAALILEVPFDSLSNVVRQVVPVPLPLKLILRDRYENLDKIAGIHTPLLIMGGSEDPTVPVILAQNLFKHAAEPKKIIIYEGGAHNDLYNFRNYRDILNWLRDNEKARR